MFVRYRGIQGGEKEEFADVPFFAGEIVAQFPEKTYSTYIL